MKYKCKGNIKDKKSHGWHLNLYRNKDKGYVGGVCAGLADHFDVDAWVVRLFTFGGFLFLGSLVVMAYIALWWFLDIRPQGKDGYEYEYDERQQSYRPKKMFKYSDSANSRLRRAKEKLDEATRRVTEMERHVTSRKFDLDREFSKIRD
ncbi:PspC domain-containing protein [Marinomonas transparens]|uniref:PspC domain-containing protein n=1 Tax=Marinomonas transparens TaxID=2795388 RepID=A0A934MZU9_9GAMM|nr:PspC domain-containing protein [Marinomonas transparens]MBJ7536062.1 PspC domain-containing protein [Marinomonas transparens]